MIDNENCLITMVILFWCYKIWAYKGVEKTKCSTLTKIAENRYKDIKMIGGNKVQSSKKAMSEIVK